MRYTLIWLLTICLPGYCLAQSGPKKEMDPEVYDSWNTLDNAQISPDGQWISYNLLPGEGDPTLQLYQPATGNMRSFHRGEKARFTDDNRFMIFALKVFADSLKQKRRLKIKEKDLPVDSLAIYELRNNHLTKNPGLISFKVPEKWSGWIAYQTKGKAETAQDSSHVKKSRKKRKKEEDKDLILRRMDSGMQDTIAAVSDYYFAKRGHRLILSTSGDSTRGIHPGIYLYDCDQAKLIPVFRKKGKYPQLAIDESGNRLAFVADLDTSDARIRPFQLYSWRNGSDSAQLIPTSAREADWILSEHLSLEFSENGLLLYFGMAPPPFLKDTSLLPEEIVNVEVWNYKDKRLYTQQNVQLKEDQKKAYSFVYHSISNQVVQLADLSVPILRFEKSRNAAVAVGYNDTPYLQTTSWEGGPASKDIYLIDLQSGNRKAVARGIKGTPSLSPAARFAYWYDYRDTAWVATAIQSGQSRMLTNNRIGTFYDELNDRPMLPQSYGLLGWTKADEAVLVYDRYDIWKIDPEGKKKPLRLTKGREQQITYRYISLDPEERFIDPDADLLLHQFNHISKASGYARLSLRNNELKNLLSGEYYYTRRIRKARDNKALIYSRENFKTFPDLLLSDTDFASAKAVSNANPQQKEYRWGSAELYTWTSLSGEQLNGILIKPDNFDPTRKYPMIVNFYERSSDRLHRHRAPYPHRSTINYSYYANRGYLIFNPDVPYRIGYPGESAYNAVVSGITSLINKGFVDKENIGVQGHSWGGYQIAHLITRTNIFKCAEAGAPVVNMFSAYGGIRWGSGMSRMFQYEQTQSRIGGTIWEYPLRYLENSPLFFADKIETPVLILHNDKDGAVPWYQGIEFFVALRRLGKPAWMLNYNDEPHWPLKRQNRIDFNLRMQQFFDHYLKGTSEPEWMESGIPALEREVNMGW